MGEHIPFIAGPLALLVGLILIARKKKPTPQEQLLECREVHRIAMLNLSIANRLLARVGELTWTEVCLRLAQEGTNPALMYLLTVDSEARAKDMFMAAHGKLVELVEHAALNVELAQSFVPESAPDEKDDE